MWNSLFARSSARSSFLSALTYEKFPAVRAAKSAVKELVSLLARSLDVHETESLSRHNGLLALAANDFCPEFHVSPPDLGSLFSAGGKFVGHCFFLIHATRLAQQAIPRSQLAAIHRYRRKWTSAAIRFKYSSLLEISEMEGKRRQARRKR